LVGADEHPERDVEEAWLHHGHGRRLARGHRARTTYTGHSAVTLF
jgi:hypothetical protein